MSPTPRQTEPDEYNDEVLQIIAFERQFEREIRGPGMDAVINVLTRLEQHYRAHLMTKKTQHAHPPEDEHTVLARPVYSEFVDRPDSDSPVLAHEEPQGGGCETPDTPREAAMTPWEVH